ncbi:Retrovirus-related Pol polyprotein from transposon 297 [Vitis vinifera]|uniref:Retrovirus-related Pol polyprotein from transposon 297 n=1 Tax=Vitis vinifera TaxID=29760 RepID=A0A438BRF2_VITVI|nr:Retrovirus-related Pol polyprotein from transposon 297 [Vitis vinifera]
MHPPRMSAPSCIVPPLEQLIIRPHIVPLLPNFHGMESENHMPTSRSLRRTNGLKRQISNFSANENEKFYECWERYMEAINACPHHGFDTWLLLYVSEISRGWDEPNSREMGRMKGSCKSKGWNVHVKPPPYQPQAQTQAPQQTSSVEQAIVNLSKVMGDFMGEQKAINSQLYQKIENVESSQIKRMDGMQNDLSQKIDNIQYSISRLTNLNTMNEKGKFPSQPSQNPNGVHEVETQDGESSKLREVKAVITLRSGKEVDQSLPKAFLTEQVSAIIQCKSPVKYKDPGCPTISVNIGGTHVEKALLDLGASVNLLSYSVYKQLGLGGLKPTTITLSLADRSVKIPRGVIEDVLVQVDKFYYPMDFVVLDTDPTVKEANYVPIILGRPFLATSNAIINCKNGEEILPLFNKEDSQGAATEDPPKLVLKPLPVDMKYAYLEENEKCPVVVSSTLTSDQEDTLLGVLRKCKKAIGWKISDLKGISPLVCTHHIYMEEDAKTSEAAPEEVESSHERGDSLWVSPTQVVPKKSGITVIQNEKGEEVSTHLTSRWRVCIDYKRLNSVTRKDHFPLPFMDQVLERVSGHPFYCFLDGYSGYFQIEIDLEDQEKTIFTCPFGTFAYRRMPFGLCNAPATFQRCMLSIFSDMVERIMEVFMDDITVYGDSYKERLLHLEVVLQRCIEKNLVLNWGEVSFYDAKFVWDEKCQKSFEELKQFFTTAPIVRAPNWKLPFEVMCDASDLAMGAILGQREDGKPYVIYYASKTLNEAQRTTQLLRKSYWQ